MSQQVKGFRTPKTPTKKEVMGLNEGLQNDMARMQSLIQMSMQQVYRLSMEMQQQVKELEALANLVGTRSLDATEAIIEGDVAIINYRGISPEDGLPFEGGSANRTALRIGSNHFIPGFEQALVGRKTGEEFTINITFPAEYHAKEMSGKEFKFDILVLDVKRDIVDATSFNKVTEDLIKKKKEQKNKESESAKNEEQTQTPQE